MIRAADGVLVVLDHQQRVALLFQFLQRVQKNPVVAWMQADGWFVEDVAHTAQIRAKLGGEPDALRLAAGQRRRRAVERQVGEPDFLEEAEPRTDFSQQVARDLLLPACEQHPREKLQQIRDRQLRQVRDRLLAEAHRQRDRIQAFAVAALTGLDLALPPGIPPDLLAALLLVETLQFHAGAVAGPAPAVPGVEREQPRIEFGEAGAAGRAGAFGRERRLRHRATVH